MSERRTTRLRRLLAEQTLALPGVFNALTAMLVEQTGFQAVYVSGAGLSNSAGFPDEGLLTLPEFVQQAKYIAQAVSVPIICDADTGFGEALNVARTVREFEAAGAAGIHLEDQEWPKRCGHLEGKTVIEGEAMADKIRAAVQTKTDPDFLLIARTDARSVEGLDPAIRRSRLYVEAGADAIFPEALETEKEFQIFAEQIRPSFGKRPAILVANMTEFGKSPLTSVESLGGLGYRMVLFPQTALRVALNSMREVLSDLKKKGTQKGFVDRMMTRQELYELLQYEVGKSSASKTKK
ncbi:MAG: methylisocitrate lyase [Deltaproteobacteria bacterium]|nr:methylisocitrate lyase [Armatimonadota bacterium]NIM24519.1 methylisocitrate lyase [Armatimonadota bacterium]NIO10384.1 methylisocitrate lyase [Deltaproteobacteria bacterium]NIO98278.1 methylisocitrate lyase [Armatimonadota bacterium]